MENNKYLEAALFYASRGWQVFPIMPGQKEPPLCKWRDEATTDPEKIKAWWSKTANANVGIATGKVSGIVVLDVDTGKSGNESLFDLTVEHGKLPETPEALTGGGGRHFIFAHPGQDIPNSASKLGAGLDIRGDGGYIVAPPSLHPSGRHYEWELSSKPSRTRLAQMPVWMITALVEQPHKEASTTPNPIQGKFQEGARNQTLASLAGTMRRRGISAEAIYSALITENDLKCDPPLSKDEVFRTAASVSRYDPSNPPRPGNNGKKEFREPVSAVDGILAFLDILPHLEGRSIPTFIPKLDLDIGGLERQTLSVLAARPSMGKSTLAWQIARSVSASKRKVYFFSLEMSSTSLWAKAICSASGHRWKDLRNGNIPDNVMNDITSEASSLMGIYEDLLLLDDGMNTTDTIWQGVEIHKPDLVVIDHLRCVSDTGDNEVQRLGNITQRLKDMAKSFNCAVLCLAQLNRGVESRDNKRPTLADLRDSGQIEENADLIMMMYRDDYYDPPAVRAKTSETEILVRKFRDDINNQRILLKFDMSQQWFDGV